MLHIEKRHLVFVVQFVLKNNFVEDSRRNLLPNLIPTDLVVSEKQINIVKWTTNAKWWQYITWLCGSVELKSHLNFTKQFFLI